MKTKLARDLANGLIVDIDGAIAGLPTEPEARHSAAMSAIIVAARLAGGLCVNMARIAKAAEDIADKLYEDEEDDGTDEKRS